MTAGVPLVNIIMGPTASGKSALAFERAQKTGGVIINADVMQLYRELPILTAQPTSQEQQAIPHRLYSVLAASDAMSAQDWTTLARNAINDALAKGQTPYITGGTGFYIKALLEGFSPVPASQPDIRAALMDELARHGLPALYAQLQVADPDIAARLKPGDTQRIIRALEVYRISGTPLSRWQAQPAHKPADAWQTHVTCLLPEREAHRAKIKARLDVMLDGGVLDEVAAFAKLIDTGQVPPTSQLIKAHGYRAFAALLRGETGRDEAIEHTVNETRQYAKRQKTWMRHQLAADEVITV